MSLSGPTRAISLSGVKEEDEERKDKVPPISHLKRDLVITLIRLLHPQAKPAQLLGYRNNGEVK